MTTITLSKIKAAQVAAPAGYIDQTAVQWIQSHQGGYASASIYPNEVNGTVPFWLEAPAAPVAQPVEWLRTLLDVVMDFRHSPEGMLRGGEYVRADALIEAALSAAAAPVVRGDLAWSLDECDRVVRTLRHLSGIAERGEGRTMRDDETVESFVLGYVQKLEAVATAAPADPVAPAGWVLVPVEPTPAMRQAGAGWGTASSTWEHMLAAAPAAPVAQPLTPRGFLLHWPKPGGGRELIWSEKDGAGVMIGCPVEPVFSYGVRASGTDQEGGV